MAGLNSESYTEFSLTATYRIPQECMNNVARNFGLTNAGKTFTDWIPCTEQNQTYWVTSTSEGRACIDACRKKYGRVFLEMCCDAIEVHRSSSTAPTYTPPATWSVTLPPLAGLGWTNGVFNNQTGPWNYIDDQISYLSGALQYGTRLLNGHKVDAYSNQTSTFNLTAGSLTAPSTIFIETLGFQSGGPGWVGVKLSDIAMYNSLTDCLANEMWQGCYSGRTDTAWRQGFRYFQKARHTIIRPAWSLVDSLNTNTTRFNKHQSYFMSSRKMFPMIPFASEYTFKPLVKSRWQPVDESIFFVHPTNGIPFYMLFFDDTEQVFPLLMFDFPIIVVHMRFRVSQGTQ
jgi:hypothetical protein